VNDVVDISMTKLFRHAQQVFTVVLLSNESFYNTKIKMAIRQQSDGGRAVIIILLLTCWFLLVRSELHDLSSLESPVRIRDAQNYIF